MRADQLGGTVLGLVLALDAQAGEFSVSPTTVALDADAPTALITIHNTGDTELRFEASAFDWQQGPDGAMELEPTDAVAIYPSLVVVGPGASRNLRIGTTATAADTERSFRVFVAELPPVSADPEGQIRVLTRFGIPVFVEPPDISFEGHLGELRATPEGAALTIHNDGNAHVKVQQVEITGYDGDGAVVASGTRPGWYVLAGGALDAWVPLSADACAAVRRIEATSITDHGTWARSIDVDGSACGAAQ